MNCSIHKNRFGKVVEVKTQTGEDSVLFKSLAGLPFIETMEEAATLLASSLLYTPTVSKSPSHIYPETKEPKLFFKTNTDVTESYKTALLNNTDKNVEYGFMGVNGNLIAIGSFSTTTNNDSVIGAINEAISTDLIEEKKVFDGTSYSLKGVGSSKLESKVSAVKAYSLLQAVPNNQYQIMAGGFLSLPQAEVELPETEVDTTPVAETIKNPITAYNTPQELTQQVEQFELDLKEIKEKSIANGTFMLAPNGNNSNLSEIEWLIVRHPNFINWFGDWINSPETASKVVDKNGEPEVVYHGSNTMGFHKFSISYVRDGGFFFSSNDRISKTYTRENNEISFEVATNKDEALRIAEDKGLTVQIEDEDYYIYSNDGLYAEVSNEEDLILTINNFEQSSPGLAGFFINLRDPMVVDGYGANWDEISGYESSDLSLRLEYNEETEQYDFEDYDDSVEEFSTIVDAYQHIESTYGEYVADKLKDSLEEDQSYGGRGVGEYYYQGNPQTGEEAPPGMTTREWVKEATHYNDHDGVIFRDIDDSGPHGTSGTGDVFVVTNPSDIKSLDNIGQFDSNNEDIRFSKVGKLEGISNIPVSQKEVVQVIKPILDSVGVDYEFKNTKELRDLGGMLSNQRGVPKGALSGETVYLNSEVITLDTPIHELGHLWINKIKTSNPELYNKGLELINTSDGAKYFEYVKQTQPSLEENSTEFYEEALAQAIGDNGARIIDAKRKTSFVGWVNSLFKWVGEQLGISEISPEKLQTMKLKEFATAVAIETLKGNTVAGALESYPGEATTLKSQNLVNPVKYEDMGIKQDLYPSDAITKLPVKDLKSAIEEYEGRVVIITSDATGVHYKDGELIQGGPGYITLNENVRDGIGFASLDEKTAQATGTRAQKIGNGKPVLMLIMTQNLEAAVGNKYGAQYLFENIINAKDTSRFKTFKNAFKKVISTYYELYITEETFKYSEINKEEHKRLLLDVIDNLDTNKYSLEEVLNHFTDDTNFEFRRNLLKNLIYLQNFTSRTDSSLREVREFLVKNNVNFSSFASEYLDKSFDLEAYNEGKIKSEQDIFGAVVAGFGIETFSSPNEMKTYISEAQKLGVEHKQFNGKIPAIKGSQFILDAAYPVNDNFSDYVEDETEFTKEGNKIKDTLIKKWDKSLKKEVYKNFKDSQKIKFKAWIAKNHPELLQVRKGSPSTDVAGGKGVRFKEGAQELMLQDALKRFELLQGKGGVTNFKVGEVLINIDLNEDAINIKAIKNLSPTSNRETALKELFNYADSENKKVIANTPDKALINILKDNGFIQKYESQESEFVRPDKVNFSIIPANSKSVYTKEDIVEVTDAKRYSEAMSIAIEEMKKASPNDNKSLQVDSVSETKAQEILDSGGKIFMSKDNMAGGYVLPNGYMGGLFKNPITNKTRAALPLQQARIEAGGRFFDSYDLNEDTYLKNGFRPLVRMDFNEEYAPENWEQTSLVTKPDNVFFIYDPTYKATKGEGDRINDYAEAFSFVTNYLSLENKSANTQGFFSAAVRGEHAPNREWEPEVEFTEKQNRFKQNYYDKHMGNFDAHIATNIPTFRENQIRVASGLVDMLSKEDGTSLIYDIGGSEGGFVKSITDASNGKIRTINLDANQDMQEVHNSNPVEGSVFINEAFFQGFTDNGVTYNTHIPSEKADVVHESMTFQFISHVREPFIKEVKSKYLKEDGIFLLEEKITPETQEQWEANELVKDEFKLKYYSQQYIDRKKEEVLVGMKANQTPYKTLLSDLKKEFLYVEEYWDSGNFKGVIATNSKNKLNAFLDSVGGKMITKYNEQLYKEIPDSAVNSLIENLVNKGDINLSCGI